MINSVRTAIDREEVTFYERGKHPTSYQRVSREASQLASKPSAVEIEQFVAGKTYWLGFKAADTPRYAWIADPWDGGYGHSHAYALILGLIQLAGGALLLFRKTALLGAALMLPVMTNIVMINVFFHIAWGAMATSAFIFASMLAVLWHSRHALVGVFWTDQAGEPASVRRYHRTIAALVVLRVITLMGFGLWLSAHK